MQLNENVYQTQIAAKSRFGAKNTCRKKTMNWKTKTTTTIMTKVGKKTSKKTANRPSTRVLQIRMSLQDALSFYF